MSLEKILEGVRNSGAGNIFPLQVSTKVKNTDFDIKKKKAEQF